MRKTAVSARIKKLKHENKSQNHDHSAYNYTISTPKTSITVSEMHAVIVTCQFNQDLKMLYTHARARARTHSHISDQRQST